MGRQNTCTIEANVFGPGTIVGDPARPSDLYVGGSSAGLWKSTDYGFTWTLINDTLPDVPRGTVIAVAGTTPATIWGDVHPDASQRQPLLAEGQSLRRRPPPERLARSRR